jgi:hypothetical protein
VTALSATLIWGALRHPVRSLAKHWPKRAAHTFDKSGSSSDVTAAAYRCQSPERPERLERIAAYARCGYFHMAYMPGLFVVPLEIPPE